MIRLPERECLLTESLLVLGPIAPIGPGNEGKGGGVAAQAQGYNALYRRMRPGGAG